MKISIQPRSSRTNISLLILAAGIFATTTGYDIALMSGLNILPAYNAYFKLTTATTGLLSAATYIGSSISCLMFGYIANIIGRKKSIAVSALIQILGVVLMAAARNVVMFLMGRIVLGFGSGASGVVAPAWLAETLPFRVRGPGLALIYAVWYVGALTAAGVTYGTSSYVGNAGWRIPAALQAIWSILCLVILIFTPESPRWLAYQGRYEEALDIVARTHSDGDRDDPITVLQYKEIVDTMKWEKENKETITYAQIFRTGSARRRVMLACSVAVLNSFSGNNIITYYLGTMLSNAGITSDHTKLEINICINAFCFIVAIFGSQMTERMGRRTMALFSVGGFTICLYLVGALSGLYGSSDNTSAVYATVAMIFLFQGCYSFGVTNMTSLYPPEVLNYSIRTTGMAMWTLTGNLLALFVTFVIPFALTALGWKFYMINGTWDVLEFLFIFFCWVETKGKTLEEIDALFEGEKHSDVPDLGVVIEGKAVDDDVLVEAADAVAKSIVREKVEPMLTV